VRRSRRQIVNRILEAAAVLLVGVDLVVLFVVYRPLGEKLSAETHHHAALRQTIRSQQVRVDLLTKYSEAFPEVGKGLEDFAKHRTPARREAYSTADHLIHKVADASGVKLSTVGFRLEREQKEPLQRLALEINAEGPYAGLVKFSHALETADQFMLVRDFTITPGDDSGGLALRLGVDLYLTP